VHVAVAIDELGRRVGELRVPTSMAGLRRLHAWAHRLGHPIAWGVEGTGSYGARLARLLADRGDTVLEVSRPDRRLRRDRGKSDPIDAEAAARAVLAGTALGQPKQASGVAASLRQLRAARQAAVKAVPRPSTSSARCCWTPLSRCVRCAPSPTPPTWPLSWPGFVPPPRPPRPTCSSTPCAASPAAGWCSTKKSATWTS
jgi:hypothetical protein